MKKPVSSLFTILTVMMIVSNSSVSATLAFATTPPHKQGIDFQVLEGGINPCNAQIKMNSEV